MDVYNDQETVIKFFLRCSITSEWKYFNFTRAFKCLQWELTDKLNQHAQLSKEEFSNYWGEFHSSSNTSLDEYAYSTDYITLSREDVYEAIENLHYNKTKEVFEPYFEGLLDLHTRLSSFILSGRVNYSEVTLEEKILLFDELIHAQHVTGDLFGDINIDLIKEQVEEELKETVQ